MLFIEAGTAGFCLWRGDLTMQMAESNRLSPSRQAAKNGALKWRGYLVTNPPETYVTCAPCVPTYTAYKD